MLFPFISLPKTDSQIPPTTKASGRQFKSTRDWETVWEAEEGKERESAEVKQLL